MDTSFNIYIVSLLKNLDIRLVFKFFWKSILNGLNISMQKFKKRYFLFTIV